MVCMHMLMYTYMYVHVVCIGMHVYMRMDIHPYVLALCLCMCVCLPVYLCACLTLRELQTSLHGRDLGTGLWHFPPSVTLLIGLHWCPLQTWGFHRVRSATV